MVATSMTAGNQPARKLLGAMQKIGEFSLSERDSLHSNGTRQTAFNLGHQAPDCFGTNIETTVSFVEVNRHRPFESGRT